MSSFVFSSLPLEQQADLNFFFRSSEPNGTYSNFLTSLGGSVTVRGAAAERIRAEWSSGGGVAAAGDANLPTDPILHRHDSVTHFRVEKKVSTHWDFVFFGIFASTHLLKMP